jgi:PhoH-like ATPase
VLDTNVLLHDPMCLFRFEEHDIFLPMIVLEELDGHKKGMTEVARNARQTSRTLDALAGAPGRRHRRTGLQAGQPPGTARPVASLFFQTQPLDYSLPTSLPQGKADNQILGVVEALRQHAPREVVLVSKDINMRVKARALGWRRRLPERQDAGRRRPAVLGRTGLPPTSGPPMARRGKLATAASTPSTASAARWCRSC